MANQVYKNVLDFKNENEALGTKLPFSEDVSVLSESVQIGSRIAPNRLVCQAMEGCDGTSDGSPDELTIRRYHRLAEGGAGIIWFEATAVCPEGRANPRQLWMTDSNIDSFKKIADEMREKALKSTGKEPLIILQATHSGRYSKPEGTPAPIIAYNNPLFEGANPIDKSRIVTDEQLDRIGEGLVNTSRLAEKAGFDGVDIKCCHRYLNSELLSAYEREGRYGGSLENRTRLLRESVAGAIANCGKDFIVTTRLNVYDGFEYPLGFGVSKNGGTDFDPTEPMWLLAQLADMGVELVNITMGNPYFNPHVNRPYAQGGYEPPEHPLQGVARMLHGISDLAHANPKLKLISSGLSYLGAAAPGVASAFIKDGGFEFAGFGRTILAYPDFAKDILASSELNAKKLCICCSKCTELMRNAHTPGCVVRDKLYTELYKSYKESKK
ncbi:MAG: flavin oxidoreductase/NADH oxidase [Clostridia bacterium]|nr:flavin oxidoreductase/NADH oxidase [Clostridia bacterium]